MSDTPNSRPKREARPIGALIGSVIEPVCAKRGFATADLISAWSDIVGPRYARSTQPEKLTWPRRDQTNAPSGATLVVRVDAGMAIYLQHEVSLVLERVNGFLGFGAVKTLRIVQGPVVPHDAPAPLPEARLSKAAEGAIADTMSDLPEGPLRDALERLGRGVYSAVERS